MSDNENNVHSSKKRTFCKHCKNNNTPYWVLNNHYKDQCNDHTGKIQKAKCEKHKSGGKGSDNWYNKLMAMVVKLKKDRKKSKKSRNKYIISDSNSSESE